MAVRTQQLLERIQTRKYNHDCVHETIISAIAQTTERSLHEPKPAQQLRARLAA
jgi:hypothetical protein